MARQPRIKVKDNDAWYHLRNQAAAHLGEYPLQQPGAREEFLRLLRYYSEAYFCGILSHCAMGNHFHIVAHFEAFRKLTKPELMEKALILYPKERHDLWPQKKWERLNERLFDVSEFMKNLQQAFATWYNRNFNRKGHFWGDRFKNTILTDFEAVQECMMYVELNPFRAYMVELPEDYAYSSLSCRINSDGEGLLDLSSVWGEGTESSLQVYLELVHLRGSVRTRERQRVISPEVLERVRLGSRYGELNRRQRYFSDGLVLGSEARIQTWMDDLRDAGSYSRRRNPTRQGRDGPFTIREQRRNFVSLT